MLKPHEELFIMVNLYPKSNRRRYSPRIFNMKLFCISSKVKLVFDPNSVVAALAECIPLKHNKKTAIHIQYFFICIPFYIF